MRGDGVIEETRRGKQQEFVSVLVLQARRTDGMYGKRRIVANIVPHVTTLISTRFTKTLHSVCLWVCEAGHLGAKPLNGNVYEGHGFSMFGDWCLPHPLSRATCSTVLGLIL